MSMRDAGRVLKRRGLLAGVAAVLAASLARLGGGERAEATHAPAFGTANADSNAIHAGVTNPAIGSTEISVANGTALALSNGAGDGLAAQISPGPIAGGFGVIGRVGMAYSRPTENAGMHAHAGTAGLVHGLIGTTNGDAVNASGVKGIASFGVTNGVWGQNTSTSSNAAGVFGQATATSTLSVGVWGRSESTNAGAIGVFGHVNAPGATGFGVRGESVNGIGVYGQSTNSYGCGGATSMAGYAGLFGYASVAGAAAFLGVNGAPGGTAGYFHGAVTVDGPFQVVNGPKNALVSHPDGSHRRMYCQESPEPWFEDFGRAQLQAGKATVRLDPDFAAVSRSDDYSVFPIPEGECKGLYVAARTPASFEVREVQGGTTSIPFSYRLVARRKDDVGQRMEKVELPKMAPLDVEKLTRTPEPPSRPEPSDRSR